VLRFLVLAVPTALLVLAGVDAGASSLGAAPNLTPIAAHGAARAAPLPTRLRLAIVAFEAVALVALFLLVQGRSRSPVLDGFAAGLAAWLFRGPLLVATVASITRLPTAPFWQMARVALVALPAAGLAIGILARRMQPLPPLAAGESNAAVE
jgi:hypothetical protein